MAAEFEPHTHPVAEVAERLASNPVTGLTEEEASRRLAQYGANELREEPPPTLLQMLWEQFNNFVVILLIVAAIISAIVGAYTGEGYVDALAIVAIVALNAILGIVQEGRAEAALRALKKMTAPEAHVVRDGKIRTVAGREVVPGDVVLLDTGNYIPADVRLIEGFNLTVDESPLTGESVPVQKRPGDILPVDATLGDRRNMAFMGSVVTYGRGRGLVVSTGMQTEIGHIAEMLQSYDEPATPLQQRLDQLGRWLGTATLIICAVVFGVGLLRLAAVNPISDPGAWLAVPTNQEALIQLFMTAISLAIAAVPEGLPAVVTIALALGMQRMIRRHVLIRRLAAVETLGSANVICSDKTGTLTTNEMTVVRVMVDDQVLTVSGEGFRPDGGFSCNGRTLDPASSPTLQMLARGAMLCNDAVLEHDGGTLRLVGDPTEGALLTMAIKAGLDARHLAATWPRVAEVPFDSERKRMTTIHRFSNGQPVIHAYTKGAPELVLEHCDTCLINGEVQPLDERRRAAILQTNADLAGQALRVLAIAYRPLDSIPEEPNADEIERHLTFVGLAAMRDPARPEVRDAIRVARTAGIRTVMITGDYPDTAAAIAGELGLLDDQDSLLTGADLSRISDEDLARRASTVSVYARVNPVHKMRIVEAIQSHGHVVAMTGDGVNDAPALKRAHIGVAMGITGTDVSKQTADMVLTDDNYASIVAAIEEGRIIYANIRKFVFYLISCNVGEILIIFVSMLLGLPLPLLPIHLLWLNLVTDGAPALALGLEQKEPDIMRQKPRPAHQPIITRDLWILTSIQAVVETAATLGAFVVSLNTLEPDPANPLLSRTIAFTTLVVAELLRAFTARSERFSIWQIGLLTNRWMIYAVSASLALLLGVIYLPFLEPVFNTVALTGEHWLTLLPFTLLPSAAAEIAKFVMRRHGQVQAAM
ncbi:MAG: cation-translocating P-type ATPase [Anaerolineae bacterium]|nr:cation-translocating P-type ATPase [Anaerolineae bacterium]